MKVEDFINYLKFEKRYSEHTIISYSTDLKQFTEYLSLIYEIQDLQEVKTAFVRSWLVHLMENGLSSRSINRKITTLKSYYRYAQRYHEYKENPMLKVQSPKIKKSLPVFIEESKMEILFEEVEFREDWEGCRDKAIISLFYLTGVRLSELITLESQNIDYNRKQIKVLGKRNKERIIPITAELIETLKSYNSHDKDITHNNKHPYFFVTNKGAKLYPKLVYRLVKSYINKVTTISKKSPHVLRHTFATHLLNKGADINAIKELLGHTNLSATQIYTHNTIEKLREAHKAAHPRK